ncbi:MAG TPA: fused MFS/spermidine synthase [Tahibacter sp.]|nr:fused MFS/spermidine synthase [Tahibacter sp.]
MAHPKPYIVETEAAKSLHFTQGETQSRMWKREPDALVFEYTRLMMGFALFAPDVRDIAMIGLGGGSLAKFCHRYLPRARIDVVEINPHVIALRDAFRVPPDDRRFTVHADDGVRFMRAVARRYDALLLDGYDHAGMPARLRAPAFIADCRAALEPAGLFVVNINSDDTNAARFIASVRAEFDERVLVVDDAAGGNRVVFAGAPLARRVGAIERPESLAREAWAQLVLPYARIRTAQHGWLAARA